MRDEHVKDAAQDAAEDLTQDVAEDVLGAAEDGLLSVSDGTRQLSGIWLGLWASASGGAAQSASVLIVRVLYSFRQIQVNTTTP